MSIWYACSKEFWFEEAHKGIDYDANVRRLEPGRLPRQTVCLT